MDKIKLIASKLIFPAICIVLVIAGIMLGMNWNRIFNKNDSIGKGQSADSGAVDWDGEHEVYEGLGNDDQIQIPGFDLIKFKAGELEQKVNIHNPIENKCYFKLTLSLPDGTAIWQSELLEPGKAFYDIKLNRKLDEGNYEESHLLYECFTYDEKQTPLNGADIKLTIKVIK